jgi:hypothetical protein
MPPPYFGRAYGRPVAEAPIPLKDSFVVLHDLVVCPPGLAQIVAERTDECSRNLW